MLGFALRTGYDLVVDDWRVNETWKTLNGKIVFPTAASRIEWWILWRRVAGGLTAGQQQSLAGPLIHSLKDWSKTPGKPRSDQAGPQEIAEQCRLVGACEWLAPHLKQSLGETLLEVLARPVHESVRSAAYWALGRLGARHPVYGPLNTVLSTEIVVRWIERIERLGGADPMQSFDDSDGQPES